MLERSLVASSHSSTAPRPSSIHRLNWGCGAHVAPGWINSDVKDTPGIDLVADIRKGLPLASESIDYAVSIHALPELAFAEQVPALQELGRVLRPGGVLRLALPDLAKGIEAYLSGDEEYFMVDEEAAASPGGRFILHMLWYGYSRTLFLADFTAELLEKAGFVDVRECAFQETASDFTEITSLDNRPNESFFIEASRASGKTGGSRDPYTSRMPQGSGVQILEMTHATPNDRLRGHFRVEDSEEGLKLIGWALGFDSPVTQVEVETGGQVVARAPIAVARPDIAEAFPGVAGAETAGFQLVLQPSGNGKSQLRIQASLENGEKAPFGELEVLTARPVRRERRGLFRRRG
jgi:predicted SAM-dependent methyltransferase